LGRLTRALEQGTSPVRTAQLALITRIRDERWIATYGPDSSRWQATEVDDEDLLISWQAWIERLRPVVSDLLESRALWQDLRTRMLVGHREYGRAPILLYAWYVDSTIIQVRRLVDPDDRTWSLRLLLNSIQRHAHLVTLDRLDDLTKDPRGNRWNLAELAHGDRGADPPDRLVAQAVERDTARLVKATERIVRVGHGYVAHLDEAPREANARLEGEELAEADEVIKQTYLRYRRLLFAADLDFAIDTSAIGWHRFVERVGAPLSGGAEST
jgi:hypothetical protein